ncbi:MAG: T9SS type A sorting domain-containing protein [Candidatus Eisenbacteria bacterium]|nr:T9SS type A sorting domain-containing protein [Candidatus Eisenbacteria bacterium]
MTTQVEVAPNGDLWLGTDSGCIRWDGTHSTIYTTANSGLPANQVHRILISPEGIVWIAAFQGLDWPYHGGLARFDGTTWTTFTRDNAPLPHEQISALGLDASGRLWIGTGGEGIAVLTLIETTAVPQIGSPLTALQVYPNPATRHGSITVSLARPGVVTGGLFDTTGRRVLEVSPTSLPQGHNVIPFDVDRLAAGSYLLRLRTPEGDAHSRLVVVR